MIQVCVSTLNNYYLLINFSEDCNYFTILRFHILNKNAINIFEAYNFVGCNSIEALVIFSTNIIAINVDELCESYFSFTSSLILREEWDLNLLVLNSINMKLDRIEHSHCPGCIYIEILSNLVFENSEVNIIFITSSSNTDRITEVIDGFCRITSSSHTVDSENSWIIPPVNHVVENQPMQCSF